ncbi:uncharacterized protein LOC124270146 [Haliotis rubra]|uniref:uncharacterized protein LOC124270146 n=1 Tax=Haliotis rubra TaxID=36100 RepID=UPI001EE4F49E|nr:uncharacterized protein LOC124270146 [Haliotis rubra]
MSRCKWNFSTLDELHKTANVSLKLAMINERSKRWGKVVDSYRKLLWMIDKDNLPQDYEPPASYSMLLYEIHAHLGVALQHVGEHRKAASQFTKAINIVSIPKGGCLAGCLTNSCLMTPLYARRAFANTRLGDMSGAMRDAEKTVVLDSRNPDVYCIRALVRGARDEDSLALKDVDHALRMNPNHVCALILRGAITRPLAERIEPESHSFLNLTDFTHPCMMDFYDRFLFTLSVPHTITDINLTPDKPSKKQILSNQDMYKSRSSRPSSAHSTCSSAFRCGTTSGPQNGMATRRRHDYGEAIRKHNSRPKTATEYLAMVDKQRKKAAEMQRAASASLGTSKSPSSGYRSNDSRQGGTTSVTESGRHTRTSATKIFHIETPTNYNIPVFQHINIKQAPRMYYRPWSGDKLPIAVVHHPKPKPAFY